MAYGNFYQPYIPNYQQPQPQPQPQQSNIVWVQGEAGAKSYLVAPNTSVQLWDSESQTIYIKSADASGIPSIKIIDYTFRDNTPVRGAEVKSESFATLDDINMLQEEINVLKSKLERFGGGKNAKSKLNANGKPNQSRPDNIS